MTKTATKGSRRKPPVKSKATTTPEPGDKAWVVYQTRPRCWLTLPATIVRWRPAGGNTGSVKVRLADNSVARFHTSHVKFTLAEAEALARAYNERGVYVGSGPGGTTSLLVA